jgi:hypothetical protein
MQKYTLHFAEPVTLIMENDEIGQGVWMQIKE